MRLAVTLIALAVASPVAAQVTRLEITSREVTGSYERIKGFAHGEVDPADRRNRIIQDSTWRLAIPVGESSTWRCFR